MKKAALALAKRNLAVFPLKPRDKIPLTAHGFKDASCSPERIEEWWAKWPNANIGIATGTASGVWVLDIDGEDGELSLRKIEKSHGAVLPPTVEAITGGGGRHLYFRLPDFEGAPDVRNSAKFLGDGLDVRGEGGYVVAPPSVHKSGRKYVWSVDTSFEFIVSPVWFVRLVASSSVGNLDVRRSDHHWVNVARNGAVEGTRNHTTASLAGFLLRSGVRPDITLELVLGWNESRNHPPLADAEVEQTVISIAERELVRRRARR
jgi:hypothetical protein